MRYRSAAVTGMLASSNPRLLGCALTVSAAVHGADAFGAESVRASLEWQRDRGSIDCIDREELERAVERRLDRPVFVERERADIHVAGAVERNRRGWTATLSLHDDQGRDLGSRQLKTGAQHCSALDDSIALALGLMLDRSSEDLEATEPHDMDRSALEIPQETHAPRAPWLVELAAGGEAAVGLTPGAGLAARASVAVEPPNFWLLELTGSLWRSTEGVDAEGGSAFSLWTAALALCPLEKSSPRFRLHGCVAQRAGTVSADGFGFARNRASDDLVLTVGLRARGTYRFSPPFALRLGAGVEAPILRYRYVYADRTGVERELFRMWPLVPSAEIALAIEL